MRKIEITKPQLKLNRRWVALQAILLALVLALTLVPRSRADSGTCSGQPITLPFTDVQGSGFFCFIAQLYFQGISIGTSPTTYSPANNVTRDQMAAFLSRTQNSTLQRGSRRAALNQFWTTTPHYTVTQGAVELGTTAVGGTPSGVASDGADLWVANAGTNTVSRVRASDGQLLETWMGANGARHVLVAMGRVFVTGTGTTNLYVIDPSQPAGAVTTLSSALGNDLQGMAFDGTSLWTADGSGMVSIITPGAPFTVSNVGGFGYLLGIVYDGANIWVTESNGRESPGSLKKLNSSGQVIATVTVGLDPRLPLYDGTNIWVPNAESSTLSVVRPSDGVVLATLTGNGLTSPTMAAFDGQRILVINEFIVSLFRAADFAPLGSFEVGAKNYITKGVCSDGLNFWITLYGINRGSRLARF